MAVRTVNGVTIITPTAWKWWAIGAMGLLVMPFGLLLLFFGGMMASGKGQRVMMTQDEIHVHNWWKTRKYRWDQIYDFRVKKIKSGLFTAATMISITQRAKADTTLGKFTKFVSGGTDSIPVIGVSPQKMLALMYGYQAGHVPAPTQTQPTAPYIPAPKPIQTRQPIRERQPQLRAPAKPRPASPRSPVQPTMRVEPKGTAKPKFSGRAAKQAPMVEEGFRLFGRRPKSPFG